MYRDTLTHSTLPTCTRSGAAKSTPTVNGTPLRPPWDGSHMKSSPSPPVVWWGCGTVPLPPLVWWGVVLSLSPLCGVVGVWYCPLPSLWCGGGVVLSPSPLWCGGGVVWYVGYVWCVWSVWYGMSGKYGMFGMYGRYAMYGMNGCYCMDGKYGM